MNRVIKHLRSPQRSIQSCLSVLEDWYFDNRFRLDTRSEVSISDLDIPHTDKIHADKYKPTRTRYFRKLMQQLAPEKQGVFVDVGCGKGRILLLAALYGFNKIRGIEISNNLSRIAEQNIEAFQQSYCTDCEMKVICTNVLAYEFQHDESLFFLYSPFDLYVTENFLSRVRSSLSNAPRKLCLVINEFRFPELLQDDSVFRLSMIVRYGAAFFRVYTNY